jgi:hypothetical protein
MASRPPSPLPDDPHDPLDDPRTPPPDEEEGVLGSVPEVTECWEDAEDAGEGPLPVTEIPRGWDEEPDAEDSAQPDDPNGVSRDMASVALDRGMLQGRRELPEP